MPSKTLSAAQRLNKKASTSAYSQSGVNVHLGNQLKSGIGKIVRPTHGAEVLGGIGGFGGLFQPNFKKRKIKNPVLVSSTDGVGTKLKIAFATDRHNTIGADLVNHCLNDIAVTGARPLFFLDYLATEKLETNVIQQILSGLASACKKAGCALIGGETAQMPGLYHSGEYDLAGTIVGVVDRKSLLDGHRVKAGDTLIGLPSNGLHTNGYSLARQVLFEKMKLKFSDKPLGLTTTLEEELLKIHRSYLPEFDKMSLFGPKALHAAAHITGGGLIDNLPRVLPQDCDAAIDTEKWTIPPLFKILCHGGKIDPLEMYRVFNMGIGMVFVVSQKKGELIARKLGGKVIGTIVEGRGRVHLEPSSQLVE
ncbi:MAG: phosphoribosylformylglycinamidine cyclo-ligase [Chthoniobacterales bacterium]|nr:phosphoribosylformylglycinamidine cyclo-ligase [Chthoniobacterales bacterium]